MIDLRLATPAVVAWAGLAVALSVRSALVWTAVACWVGAALAVAILLRRPRGVTRPAGAAPTGAALPIAVLALAATALVLTSASVSDARRHPAVLSEAAAAGRFVVLAATVTDTVLAGSGSFSLTIDEVTVGTTTTPLQVPARYFGVPATGDLGIGSRITVRGTVAETDPGDATAVLVFGDDAPTLVGHPPSALEWANALRAGFRSLAGTLPGDGGALLPGLAIGDTTRVGAELDRAMKASSLSHLTAVSGANCAIVVGVLMLVGAAAGLGRAARIALAGSALVGFVVLVTPEPSVLRAGVMAALVLLALGGGRPVRGVPILSAAVIGLLVIDPFLARSAGFVLSVLATAGLLLLTRPIVRLLGRWIPQPIAVVFAVPIAAQLACQPVIILFSPSLPSYGVLANILAEPAAPLATILGLVACLLGPVAPGLAGAVAALAWVPSAWIAAVAHFFAGLPGSSIPWFEGGIGVLALAAATVLGLVAVLGEHVVPSRWRRLAASALIVGVVAYLGGAAASSIRQELHRPADWQFAQCDVGQGDAVLVRSAGRIALIDTGRDPVPLRRCLTALGISRIDLLVLTHFDLDHVGGTAAVLGMVDTALIGPSDGADDELLAREVQDGGARVLRVARGDTGRLGTLDWRVLWPPDPLRGVEPGNPASVTMRFEATGRTDARAGGADARAPELSGIFLGDLGAESQLRLLALERDEPGDDPVDVVKVAHHGSADQYPGLYAELAARVGLIGVGSDNTYGHPTRLLLDTLAVTGTVPERSDLSGLVLVAPGGSGTIEVWEEHPAVEVGGPG